MAIKSAGTYMQISDLCESCSKQNFCGNGITNHYCTGYAPITYQYHTDIKTPPFDADVELDKLYQTEQTNEEWFCNLSTEEKAEVLFDIWYDGKVLAWDKSKPFYFNRFVTWLKEVHKDEM